MWNIFIFYSLIVKVYANKYYINCALIHIHLTEDQQILFAGERYN
jgi:hypothetical protein